MTDENQATKNKLEISQETLGQVRQADRSGDVRQSLQVPHSSGQQITQTFGDGQSSNVKESAQSGPSSFQFKAVPKVQSA